MRVLHVSHGIYPLKQAGTEIYTAELAQALVAEGVDVTVAIPAAGPRGQRLQSDQLPAYVRQLPMTPDRWYRNKLRYATFRGPLWQDAMRQLLAEFKPDVIHVQHAIGFGIAMLDLLAQSRIPMVITLPDYWLLCPGILGNCRGSLVRCARECCSGLQVRRFLGPGTVAYLWRRRQQVHRLVGRARPVLAAISDATRRRFEDEGFPQDLLVTHEWGIHVAPIRQLAAQSNRPPGPSVPRIRFIGSMRPHKGCHVLVEGFKRLQCRAVLHFHGSGDESYVQELREQCRGLDAHFHGRFDHSDVGRILAESDVVVIPSTWDEAYCLVAQEAMAARKPIVASDVGGIGDRIIHGVNGFLVPPNDPVSLAAELERLLLRLPEETARLDFDRCLLDISADARSWITLYQRAMASRAPNQLPRPMQNAAV